MKKVNEILKGVLEVYVQMIKESFVFVCFTIPAALALATVFAIPLLILNYLIGVYK